MRVRVHHTIGYLASDMESIVRRAPKDMAGVVREGIKVGNKAAAYNAKRSAGAHGKHYHKAFTAEMTAPLVGEYGPDASRPQGGMSFEFGSRNQPPHLDLARSADVIGPVFAKRVARLPAEWFW